MLRIEQAIAIAKERGEAIKKKDIAVRLWPDTTAVGQQVNMTRLCAGKTEAIREEWVRIICEMCGCTADFLFGISNE